MKFTSNSSSNDRPLRDILLNRDELLQHAEELATNHTRNGSTNDYITLLKRVYSNTLFLRVAHKDITRYVKEHQDMIPAAEWFLDNYYLINGMYKEIRVNLPRKYERELPRVAGGRFQGYPRIFALMIEFIEHNDSQLQGGLLKDFVNAYQAQQPLSSGELWAVPIMLRVALLENIRRLVEQVLSTQAEREAAEQWLQPFAQGSQEAGDLTELFDSLPRPENYSSSYTTWLLRRIRDLGLDAGPLLHLVDKDLAKQGISSESQAKLEHQRQAACQVTMGHAVMGLRFLQEEDWPHFFEEISPVQRILEQDPSQTFSQMDFSSRDYYRHQVEKIARRYEVSETAVAKKVLEMAEAGDSIDTRHVGFYLTGMGFLRLERELAREWGPLRKVTRWLPRALRLYPRQVYFGGIGVCTLLLLSLEVGYLTKQGNTTTAILIVSILSVIAVSNLAITVVNWLVTRLLSPSVLPKLELPNGIPSEMATIVVIPTLLPSEARVKELLQQMEVYYLANQDQHLQFALLGDFVDAVQAELPEDQVIVDSAIHGIEELNRKYGQGKFCFFHRRRLWNEQEQVWMGWERKRGKLLEFNRLLCGDGPGTYDVQIGELQHVKYVITLDADTQLPRDSARKLVGTMAHPLHTPQLSSDGGRVISGYAIMQPRIGVALLEAGASLFSRIFAGKAGVDPYTTAVSDVYQDLFGEGCFTGKGIYDVQVFHQVTEQAFPENIILSHDLLEGIYARTALVTDIELIDGYPAKYHSFMRRSHRWIRGDWQILRWLGKDLPLVSRWKIFDNLRRSLEAPTQVGLILLSLLLVPQTGWLGLVVVALNLLLPVLLALLNRSLNQDLDASGGDFWGTFLQATILFTFLPFQAFSNLDAIIRSLYRQFISHHHLLEWETAADTERRLSVSVKTSWQLMGWSIGVVLLLLGGVVLATGANYLLIVILGIWWFVAPWLSYRLSLPLARDTVLLTPQERSEAGQWARKIWGFFEDYVNEDENWLPPDNVQIDPPNGIAHRTSPTNIGLALLASLAAGDLGYIGLEGMYQRINATLQCMEKLERWKGHFYNWYDTLSLQPLQPLYVSTVDSGNLAAYLITLACGLEETLNQPLFGTHTMQGLQDTFALLMEDLGDSYDGAFREFAAELQQLADSRDVTTWYSFFITWADQAKSLNPNNAWVKRLSASLTRICQELEAFYPWLTAAKTDGADRVDNEAWPKLGASLGELLEFYTGTEQPEPVQTLLQQAKVKALQLRESCRDLQLRLRNMALAMDFRPLYDKRLQLFSIGYRVADQVLDKSYYDLLASEARQASYVAIAKGDVPESHWFRLGRTLTRVNEQRSLVAWSGTMFEFLMPLLIMRTYPGTLLDETYRSVVAVQKWYSTKRNIPWGISESGFYAFDAQLNYQYKAFGVPGLGLKRGLIQDLVIAPYATFLTLQVEPKAALTNLRTMQELGFAGPYGLFEAIDYTPERVPVGKEYGMIQSFMAHHQGMSFLALDNILNENCMQTRFHANTMIQATELLLQERSPLRTGVSQQPEEQEIKQTIRPRAESAGNKFTTLTTADTTMPVTHFLSNGQYSVMLTNGGSGYSRNDNLDLTRWREDVTRDAWGMYFYIQNLNSAAVWSATSQPCGFGGDNYQVTYAPDRVEYCRRDGSIGTKTEIVVSPEDPVEIRRISLTNHGQHDRTLEVTSYLEVVLARHSEDLAHPAFGNLFVQTEYVHNALLAWRRPRSHNQSPVWLMHSVTVEGETVGTVQYETDRARFIGRGRSLASPQATDPNQPLSNTVGAVLDPIMSLRPRVRLQPGQTACVCFTLGFATSRKEALHLADKYKDLAAVARAFELAWTYSEMELHQLNLAAQRANEALSLGSNLLYISPCRRDLAETLRQNRKGQSALWPYAISGDLPIVLVRMQNSGHLDLVRQLLTIHEYWRLKGLRVDLVILNEDDSGYYQGLQENLRDLIASGHARDNINKPGGIFLLQGSVLPPEDVILLSTVARMTFSGQGGSCTVQLRQKSKLNIRQEDRLKTPGGIHDTPGQGETSNTERHLLYPNGYGGFSEDGREYVIELKEGAPTPLPWINVIANQDFGCLVSEAGGGYTWSGNSRENKLTPWSNDPITDPPGEALYLQDQLTGEFWSPTPAPARGPGRYTVRHGWGYSVFEYCSYDIAQTMHVYVPQDKPVKVIALRLHNTGTVERKLAAIYYAEPVMGVVREQTAPYLFTEYDVKTEALQFRNTYQEEFAGRIGFLTAIGGELTSFTGDRSEFIGRNGTLANPAALASQSLSNNVGAGFDPCAAIQLSVGLEPGEDKTIYFLLGEAANPEVLQDLLAWSKADQHLNKALEEVKAFWQNLLGALQVHTPEKSFDLLLNGWLLYQATVCRIWARSALYQSGGAYGFRDQLQDVMALTPFAPARVREQILLHCAHQFTEGDVQHWWHAEGNKGIRTKFSDDLLWLPYVTADYLAQTKDYALLDEQVEFLQDAPLGEQEDERYTVPRLSGEKASVYEHCLRAIERSLKLGEHGLPLIGSGDWNDGFSRIGIKGRGESVWLGWFLYVTLQRFSDICELRQEQTRAEDYRKFAGELLQNLELHGWDGSWYRRAYFDDGTPLGSARNDECQIDAIAQAWAVLSGAADPKRQAHAMESLEHYLLCKDEGILRLLTPPFDRSQLDPGYIKGYVPGVRENGGQYTHAATWVILAYATMGEGEKALDLFQMLNPINHTRTAKEVSTYKVEPYVMAADVYAVAPHTGRGGWTWYTGTAGWMYQAGTKGVLGLHVQGDKLVFKPCIPRHWPGYSLQYRYKTTLYQLQVDNPKGLMSGVSKLTFDGVDLEGDSVPLVDDGKVHEVKLTM